MARIVLLLPTATYRAADFLEAAGRLGIDVVVASEQAPTLAAAMGDRSLVVDLGDPDAAADAIVQLHRRRAVDGIVAVDDQGVVAGAVAAERLGLRHNRPDAVRATRDKVLLRQRLAGAGVPQPDFRVAGPADDIAALADEVGYPAVIKPRSMSASRGVIRVDGAPGASAAAARIRWILACDGPGGDDALLVESFVPGAELAVEGLLEGGAMRILAVFDKPDPLDGPYFEETIYVTPSRQPAPVLDEVAEVVAAAADAVGLTEGPVHAEVRLPPGGSVTVLELAARSIGGLCARVLRFGAGLSLEELILGHALGRPVAGSVREDAAAGVMMLPIPGAGTLLGVDGRQEASAVEGIVGLEIAIPAGRPVVPLPEGDRYLGFLFAVAATPDAVEGALRRAHALLRIRIQADDPLDHDPTSTST